MSSLNAATGGNPSFTVDNKAASATGAAYYALNIDGYMATFPDNHYAVLYNIGVNDFGIASHAQWVADVEYVIDAIHAKWPESKVYLTKPWKRNFDATADTFAGWIDEIVAARSFVYVGDDERVWLKGSDNGATMTADGIHYTAAGQAQAAVQKQAVLGY